MTALALQQRLAALGFDPGPLDGIWGRRTIAAVKRYQTAKGLSVDGVVGRETEAALAAAQTSAPAASPHPLIPGRDRTGPVWLAEARRWMGLREIAGPRSNPDILKWGRRAADWYRDDDVPWCGAFVFAQMAATLPDEPLPPNPLWARGWATFGRRLMTSALGAVLVFGRGANSGHVGFYIGEDGARFRVLGGNQSNAVTETWIAKERLLAIRWPSTVPLPAPRKVVLTGKGATSANEA